MNNTSQSLGEEYHFPSTALLKEDVSQKEKVSSRFDDTNESRLLSDTKGAENLLGNGDMLSNPPDGSPLKRIQSPSGSEEEISMVVDEVRKQSEEQQ